MFRLDGKQALITEAGSCIGEAMSRLFVQQGAQVIVVDLQSDATKRVTNSIIESGGIARTLSFDVAVEVQVLKGFG